MLIKNPCYYHWCTFYLYKPLEIHEVPYASKTLPSFLHYPIAVSFYCQGSWSKPSVNWPKKQWVLVVGSLRTYLQLPHALIQHSLFGDLSLFTKAALIADPSYSSESKRQNPRRAHQETACGQGWKTSSSVPDSIWTKTLTKLSSWLRLHLNQVLGLLWITSHLQCNSRTIFVKAFKYRER